MSRIVLVIVSCCKQAVGVEKGLLGKQNPAATKRQIGIWQHWREETEDNDRPLAEVEVERMKAFLRQYAPTSYFEIFAKEKTDR
jgi:hypothetical protein